MIVAVADTHTLIWYFFADGRLSVRARGVIEEAARVGGNIAVSAITLAELVHLAERGRLSADALGLLLETIEKDGVFCQAPFDLAVAKAIKTVDRSQIPDFPTRILAATGLMLKVPVISGDAKITASDIETIW